MAHTYRPIRERLRDFNPVEIPPDAEALAPQLARCQECGIPFCHGAGCPLDNAIPEINAAALAGRWRTALTRLLASSPFPEFTARICPALCEGSCVQGLHAEAVPCRSVEYAVIEYGFAHGLVRPRPPERRNGLRAAVVGSGPAGLAAAWRLNRAGVRVVVYERDARPGGFLRYGIPDFKLDKSVIDRRLELLADEGILFECGVEAGVDISDRLLHKRNDIIVLATGSRARRNLSIPGRDLAGVCFATDYLAAQNRRLSGELSGLPPEYDAAGRHVAVIGGGDTGSDCVGTAWRQGAASVVQCEIMPEPPAARTADNPWPEWPRTLRTSSSHEEGGERLWNVSTVSFLPCARNAARVGALECRLVEWEQEGGRLIRPVPVEGSTFLRPADLVLLAMGFTGVEASPLLERTGFNPAGGLLPRDAAGRVGEGVYACGDAATGPSLVVRAVRDGLAVAGHILQDRDAGAATV